MNSRKKKDKEVDIGCRHGLMMRPSIISAMHGRDGSGNWLKQYLIGGYPNMIACKKISIRDSMADEKTPSWLQRGGGKKAHKNL